MPEARVIPLAARAEAADRTSSTQPTKEQADEQPAPDETPTDNPTRAAGAPGEARMDSRTDDPQLGDGPSDDFVAAVQRATVGNERESSRRFEALRGRTSTAVDEPDDEASPSPMEDDAALRDEALQEGLQEVASDLASLGGEDTPDWERRLASALAFLRRRITGEYEIDEFGFDADLTENVLATIVRPIYDRWFRVETRGLENIPDDGSALVVANHSGTLPLDAAMTTLSILDHHPAHRHLRMLGADLVFQLPFLAPLARKAGNTLACNADAERLLRTGQLVGVWPEGFKGIGKPFSERYKLQRFGRGGFVSAALRTGAPIVPCSIVGAEEIYPMIGNFKTLARLLGVPYIPITPFFPWLGPLGMIPLPSKWIIEFGEPVETESLGTAAADDPMLVFNLTDQVRETIQQTLYKLLMQRRSVFF